MKMLCLTRVRGSNYQRRRPYGSRGHVRGSNYHTSTVTYILMSAQSLTALQESTKRV